MLGPKVCVIIVNWNKKDYVLRLLEALRHIDYNNYDVVVVDNASTDGSAKAIREKFPEVFLIQNKKNLGGTGGFNTGMRYALKKGEYKYIWLLDNDVMVEQTTLSGLLEVFNLDKDVGVVGSLVCHLDNKDMVIEQGGIVDWQGGTWKTLNNNIKRSDILVENLEVDYVAACSMLIKVEVLEKIGLFDDKLFIHWDDIDFCLRVKAKGYKVIATSRSIIYSDIERPVPLVYLYYDLRNALLLIKKHLKGIKKFIACYNQLRRIWKGYFLSLFIGSKKHALIFKCSYFDFLHNNFYKFSKDNLINNKEQEVLNDCMENVTAKNILVLPDGTIHEISDVLEYCKSNIPVQKVVIAINKERVNLIKNNENVDEIIIFAGSRASTFNSILNMYNIYIKKFDLGIIPTSRQIIPFLSFIMKKTLKYNSEKKCLINSPYNYKSFWKVGMAFLCGELIAPFLLLYLYCYNLLQGGKK